MSPVPARYNTGYNVGVGGAVVDGDRVLLVRRATDHGRGAWQIPGGFCEPDETLPEAAVREVKEESGLTTEVQGLLAVRSRHSEDHSTYVVFLLRRVAGEPTPGEEVDAARFFTMEEIDALDKVPEINRAIAARALSPSRELLQRAAVESPIPGPYDLFLG